VRPLQAQLRELETYWSGVARSLLARRWADPGLDLTHPQYFALHHVCERKTIPLPELAQVLRMPEQNAARVVDRMARAGLVGTSLDPADRRTVVVGPTSAGREMLARVRRARFKELGDMLRRLEPDEREELIRLFRKMAEDEPPRVE